MKTYVKPQLFLESYEVSQTIAACRWDLNHADKNTCQAEYDLTLDNKMHDPGLQLFTDLGRCTMLEEDVEGYCYTNGAAGFNLFQS